jgi:outer membrane biosynthesis protein TonB
MPLLGAPMPDPDSTDNKMFAVKGDDEFPSAGSLHVLQPVELADPPEWSPFLPVPGVYHHPLYGELDRGPATYERMLTNFKSGVYGQDLPVNAEHDPKAAGQIGKIVDMRLADSGAIEAKVEWNERGQKLIQGDRYRYVSAEFYPEWSDPVDPENTYRDVAVGLALTTKPYFKERVLPPLVASEAVLTLAEAGKENTMPEPQTPTPAPTPAPEPTPEPVETPPIQDKDDDVTRIDPPVEKVNEPESVLATQLNEAMLSEYRALKAREIEHERRITALSEENARLSRDSRTKKFTDEVRGRSDANGLPWVGEIENHVAMLVDLSEKFGEDSAQVKQYISTNRAHAELIKSSQLFSELGTGRPAESMTGDEKAEIVARQLRESNPALTKEQALAQAYREHPEFY